MRVDFTSQAFFPDPAAGIEKLRACGPVVETRFPIVGKVWIRTTHESTARVLKDSETFTLRKEGGGLAGLRWWMPAFVSALANNMLTMDVIEPRSTWRPVLKIDQAPSTTWFHPHPHYETARQVYMGLSRLDYCR
jgi:hypothetical protein